MNVAGIFSFASLIFGVLSFWAALAMGTLPEVAVPSVSIVTSEAYPFRKIEIEATGLIPESEFLLVDSNQSCENGASKTAVDRQVVRSNRLGNLISTFVVDDDAIASLQLRAAAWSNCYNL